MHIRKQEKGISALPRFLTRTISHNGNEDSSNAISPIKIARKRKEPREFSHPNHFILNPRTDSLFGTLAAPPHLLGLQVFIKQIKSLFIATSSSHNREHSLASIVVRGLGDADFRSRCPTNILDL